MVQHIIDKMPDMAQAFEPASLKLKICLEPNAMALLLQTKDGTPHGIEYLSWAENDDKNLPKTMDLLKQQSHLFPFNNFPTSIYYRTDDMMFVPTKFATNAKQMIEAQFGLKKSEILLQNNLNNNITAVWKIKATWHDFLQNQFPNHTYKSSICNLLDDIKMDKSAKLYLDFGNGLVEIIVVANKNLQLAKCFIYQTVEDLNYHLLNICDKLELDLAQVQIKVQGMVEIDSLLYTSLQQYFVDVQPQTTDNSHWPETLKSLPTHYFTGLIQAV